MGMGAVHSFGHTSTSTCVNDVQNWLRAAAQNNVFAQCKNGQPITKATVQGQQVEALMNREL